MVGVVQAAQAQQHTEDFVIDQWTIEDGLPQNTIVDIEQTHSGYLWLATNGGLVRFDGVKFRVYDTDNTEAFPSNRVKALHEDAANRLWIGTENGLVMYNGESFTRFTEEDGFGSFSVLEDGIAEDGQGRVWVAATTGTDSNSPAYIFDGNRFTSLPHFFEEYGMASGSAPVPSQTSALATGLDGQVWIIRESGILLYENENNRFTDFSETFENQYPDRIIKYRDEAGQEQLIFYTQEKQHLTFENGEFKQPNPAQYRLFELHDWWWMKAPGNTTLLYDDGGLVTARQPGNLPEIEMNYFFIDREKNTWIASFKKGLFRFKPTLFDVIDEDDGLVGEAVLAVEEIEDGVIAAITNCNGFNRISQTGMRTYNSNRPGGSTCLRAIYGDNDSTYWWGHVHLYHATQTDTIEYRLGQDMWVIYEDPQQENVLWIGTTNGAYRFENGTFTHAATGESRPQNAVHNFLRDEKGRLWAATEGGLARMPGDSTFSFISPGTEDAVYSVRALFEDPAEPGVIWAGTYGSGLLRYKNGSLTRITPEDGLYDNVVSSMLTDDNGNVWMSGNRGIYRAKLNELRAFAEGERDYITSVGYGREAGLKNPETNGAFQPAAVKGRDGKIWYPTLGGVAVVNPKQVAADTVPPVAHIEELLYHDQTVPEKEGIVLLEKGQRSFQINYTGISLSAPQKVRFRYRLVGLDEEWTQAGTRRDVFYANVPPGEYTFEVMAANRDGIWTDAAADLEIDVPPYFYETGWFWFAFGVMVLGFTYLGYRQRIKHHRQREEELNTLVAERTRELAQSKDHIARQAEQLKELDKHKNRFFTNISHELRTPLTLIIGPLKNLLEGTYGKIPEYLRKHMELMHRNGERLLMLVGQLLDLAKIESGEVRLKASRQDVSGFVEKIILSFVSHAESKKIRLGTSIPSRPVMIYFDAVQLEKIIANLLSNAVKFTPQGGDIEVLLQSTENTVQVTVKDSGIGMDEETLEHIFDRFYQADDSTTRREEGTGVGLALTKELVELHDGNLDVESAPGAGSSFTLTLKKGKAHFREDELTDDKESPEEQQDMHSQPRSSPSFISSKSDKPGNAEIAVPTSEDQTTVLVIDDNADIRTYMRSILEPTYAVIEAVDGADGVRQARNRLPDLIICDVMMPEMDGFELSRALRKEAMTECIPFVFVTAKAEKGEHMEGLSTGADDYVTKPFDASVLHARVENLLNRHRRLRLHFLEKLQTEQEYPASLSFEEKIRRVVRTHLPDNQFTVAALAEEMALSRSYLARKAKKELGMTPAELIRSMRLEQALRLLREQTGNISEIAYSVGFNSLSYFSRCFREKYDTAPSAYVAEAS